MPLDFKYIPLDPEAISGRSFVTQTELALNELHDILEGDIAEALRLAREAYEAAQNALTTALEALTAANNAETTAQQALTAAQNALDRANTAITTAEEALARANAAYDLAADAMTAVDEARTLAQEALDTANAAEQTAEEAKEAADNALAIAEGLQDQVDAAMGTYAKADTVDDEGNPVAYNLDDQYSAASKAFFDTDNTVTGSPVPTPFFFDNHVASDRTYCRQYVYQLETKETYTRSATIVPDPDDPAADVVTWNTWEEIGSGGGEGSTENVLEAITVNNPNIDADNIVGLSQNFLALAPIANGPAGLQRGFIEVRSNRTGTATLQRVTDDETNLYQRYGTFSPTPVAGNAYYLATLTSGTLSVTETLVCSVSATGVISMRSQIGTNLNIVIQGNGTALSGTMDVFIDSATGVDFKTDGFTLDITAENVTGPDSITVSFAADGTETITTDVATYPNRSTLRYLSGTMETTGDNNLAHINLGLIWTNTTGNATSWTEWSVLAASGGSVDEEARAAAAAAQSSADSASATATTALNTATDAAEAANAASVSADTAQAAASSAQTTANSALALAQQQYDTVNNFGSVTSITIALATAVSNLVTPAGNLAVSIADIGAAYSKTLTLQIVPTAACTTTFTYAGAGGIVWVGDTLGSLTSGQVGRVAIDIMGNTCVITKLLPQ